MVSLFRSRKTSPRLERLRSLSLFVKLTDAELRIVDGLLHQRDYLAGEVVFDAGEEGQAIYIVESGEVMIGRRMPGKTAPTEIARLGSGTFFGELALLDEWPRSTQARAATDCKLIIFFRNDFVSLLDSHARISSKISRELCWHLGSRLRGMVLTTYGGN